MLTEANVDSCPPAYHADLSAIGPRRIGVAPAVLDRRVEVIVPPWVGKTELV